MVSYETLQLKKSKVTVTPIFYMLNLCENLNLTVRSDLAPSIGNDIISLKIGLPNNYFIDLANLCQKAIYEDIILKFSSPFMPVKSFYIKKKIEEHISHLLMSHIHIFIDAFIHLHIFVYLLNLTNLFSIRQEFP